MARKFLKVILKGEKKVYGEYEDIDIARGGDVVEDAHKITRKKAPHDDLKNVFDKMIPHLMFSLNLAKPETFDSSWFANYTFLDDSRFEGVKCTGIQIVGKEQDGIKLTGTVIGYNDEVCALNSPIISLLDEGDRKYPLLQIIRDNKEDFLIESDQYFKGKYAPDPQQELQL